MFAIAHDVRYAVRTLRASPGFAAVAILTLALGIGVTTAMFSVVDGVLLRPLPYRDADRLVLVWNQHLERGIPFSEVPFPDVAVWQRAGRSFEALSAFEAWGASLADAGEPESVTVAQVNASFFPLLGVTPAAGRAFRPDEDVPGASRVAVLSHDLWRRRFGERPDAVGQTLKLDGTAHLVVGVLPASFRSLAEPVDVYVPLADDGARDREVPPVITVRVFGRLKPDVTIDQAQTEIDALSRGLDEQFPLRFARSARVWNLQAFRTRNVRVSLLVLLGAVSLVLLIACVNVANLLLARAGVRRKEFAVRGALGASRRRLVGQVLTESLLLGLLGGAAGVLLAWWGVGTLQQIAPASVPSLDLVGLDPRVLSFALVVSIATGVVFGSSPALAFARSGRASALDVVLREERGRGAGRARARLRSALVVVEVALSLMLLVGAGLLLQSFARLQQVEPGFDPDGVVTASVSLNADRYLDADRRRAFYDRLLKRIETSPGVTGAGITSSLPLSGHNTGVYLISDSGAVTQPDDAVVVWFRYVSAGYFRTMGIPLRQGRLFDDRDGAGAESVIVNRTLADRFWPGEDPLGKHVRAPARDPRAVGPWQTVVGVVGDIHHMALDDPLQPEMFFPARRDPPRRAAVVVRSALDAGAASDVVARAASLADVEQAVSSARTMEEAVYLATSSERLSTTLLLVFALVAVTIAAVGLYGVISYMVDQRSHEIGIRIALGARRGDVVRMVLREGVGTGLVGVALGIGGALAATRLMASMLFGVSPRDVATYVGVAALLFAVVLVASFVPARRASGIDPVATLHA